jgi:hypothetical protein
VERDDWRLESWNELGSREECLRDFDQWRKTSRPLSATSEAGVLAVSFHQDPVALAQIEVAFDVISAARLAA